MARLLGFLSAFLALTVAATPARAVDPKIVSYTLEGDVSEGEETLRAVFDDVLLEQHVPREPQEGQPQIEVQEPVWNAATRSKLAALCAKLNYSCVPAFKPVAGGTALSLTLRPAILVRRIKVTGNWPLLEEDISRRLSLRPGSVVPAPGPERERRLEEETERVKEYLAKEGFFEAHVELSVDEQRPHEVLLVVKVIEGPAYHLGEVRLAGNASMDDERIREALKHRWFFAWGQKRFSEEKLLEDLQALETAYRNELGFPRASVSSDYDARYSPDPKTKRVNLTITVREQKRIDVDFIGNARISSERLRRSLSLAQQGSYDDLALSSSADAVRRLYQSEGYFQTVVNFERVRFAQTPNFERILFYVTEGAKLPVKTITFSGNTTFPTPRLVGLVATKPLRNQLLRQVAQGGYLTYLQLLQDAERVRQFYEDQGFDAAQVAPLVTSDPVVTDDPGALAAVMTSEQHRGGLFVQFHVDEGPRNLVGRLMFLKNQTITDSELESHTTMAPGRALTAAAANAEAETIQKLYAEKGHPHAKVAWKTQPGRGTTERDLVFTVDEGPAVHFGHVFVRGNFHTSAWVVRDALGIRSGTPFAVGTLQEGQRRLRDSGLFSGVQVDLLGLEEGHDQVDVLVAVQEEHDNHGELGIRAGYLSDNKLFIATDYSLRNILGVGASIIAKVDIAQRAKSGEITGVLPTWLMHRYLKLPFRFDLTGSYQRVEDNERFDTLTTKRVTGTLSRAIGRHWQTALAYSFSRIGRDEDLIRPTGPRESSDQTTIYTQTGSIGPTLVYDNRRNTSGNYDPLNPVAGVRLSGGFLYASPYLRGDNEFVKLAFSGQWYQALGKRWQLTNSVRYNHGIPLGGSALLPEVERFFGGGDTTMRGIEKDHLATEVVSWPIVEGGDLYSYKVIPAGGNIRALYNLDLQLTILDGKSGPIPLPIAAGIFFDTGMVTNSFDGFEVTDLRHSVGLALCRLILPIGALSLEYAVPLDPQVGDDPRGELHFNIGVGFAF